MVQLSYPGVYVEEVPSGVHTITGVATSIAAFLGRASKGPLNKAVRLLSRSDFLRTFGPPVPGSDLAQAVKMFFDNGGSDCYVVRIAKNPGDPAAVTLKALDNTNVLTVAAKAQGLWGNSVRFEVDYNTPNPDETFNLRVLLEEGGVVTTTETHANLTTNPESPRYAPTFVTQSSDLVNLDLAAGAAATLANPANSFDGYSLALRPLGATVADVKALLDGLIGGATPKTSFSIGVNDGPFVPVDLTGWTVPTTQTNLENGLRDRINTALNKLTPAPTVKCDLVSVANVGMLLKITATSGKKVSVHVRRATNQDLSVPLMLGVDQGGVEPVRFSNFRPAPTATYLHGNLHTGATAGLSDLMALTQGAITSLSVDGKSVPLNSGDYNLVTTVGTDRWFQNKAGASAATGDEDGTREKLRLIAGAINAFAQANPTFKYRAEVWGYHLAIVAAKADLPFNETPSAVTTGNATFDGARALNARRYTLGTAGTSPFSTGGSDGGDGDPPDEAAYLGDPVKKTGFYALEDADLFNLMVLPHDEGGSVPQSVWQAASVYCTERRAFLLIDAPDDWTDEKTRRAKVVNDPQKIKDLRAGVVLPNAAVLYPRVSYKDVDGIVRTTGAAGAIAGLMGRIDSSRGVWKAAAGLEADLRGVLDLEVNLTDLENGVLNKQGVSCLRRFPGGIVHWGARTMAGFDDNTDLDSKYQPIRRFTLFLAESLYRGSRWVVFEPNDEPLWAKIRLNLRAFMMSLFRQGAFQGTTPDKAFYVKCDAETTTQNDRNLGIVNIEVGFAPLKPAEFVVVKIQQMAGDLK